MNLDFCLNPLDKPGLKGLASQLSEPGNQKPATFSKNFLQHSIAPSFGKNKLAESFSKKYCFKPRFHIF